MICHLELKPGVRLHGTSAEIMFAAEVVREVWEEYGSSVCIVTAGIDGKHQALGEHYHGDALDFRTTTIPTPSKLLIETVEDSRRQVVKLAVSEVARRLGATDGESRYVFQGPNYHLRLELLGTPQEHLHISFRPQAFGV